MPGATKHPLKGNLQVIICGERDANRKKKPDHGLIRREKITCKFTVGVKVKPSIKVGERLDGTLFIGRSGSTPWTTATG